MDVAPARYIEQVVGFDARLRFADDGVNLVPALPQRRPGAVVEQQLCAGGIDDGALGGSESPGPL